jgi:hypothetical protein
VGGEVTPLLLPDILNALVLEPIVAFFSIPPSHAPNASSSYFFSMSFSSGQIVLRQPPVAERLFDDRITRPALLPTDFSPLGHVRSYGGW